jgi:hypothetical protein
MNESEIIVEIGAEGGSITLHGTRSGRGWAFSMEVVDWTPVLDDEDGIHHESAAVSDWEAALNLLDRYAWFRLHPVSVHPEFQRKVWFAARERLQNDAEAPEFALENWSELCGGPPGVDGEKVDWGAEG